MKYLVLPILALLIATAAYAQQAAIIAHPSNSTSSLSPKELEEILNGKKKQWSGGQSIDLAVLKSGDIHDDVMRTYAKKSASQFKTHWRNQVFSGSGIMPKEFDKVEDMKAYVSSTPGALGYIDMASLDASVKEISISQ